MENKMQGKAGLCTPRRGPSGAEGCSATCYSTSATAAPCKFTQCFPFPLAMRSLSPSLVRNSEARHTGKKVSPVHSLSVVTLQIKVIIMNVRTLKEILVPSPSYTSQSRAQIQLLCNLILMQKQSGTEIEGFPGGTAY